MQRLRVAVHTTDPLRRAILGRVLSEAGHIVVEMQDAFDVILADARRPPGRCTWRRG